MRSLNLAIVSLAAGVLAGCVGPVQTYSGEPKDMKQIAVVTGGSTQFAGGTYIAFFVSYAELEAGKKPEFKKVGDAFAGYPRELRMLPGRYAVMTRCTIGNQYAFPAVSLQVEAGATYEITCEPVADRLSTVKASARRIDAQAKP